MIKEFVVSLTVGFLCFVSSLFSILAGFAIKEETELRDTVFLLVISFISFILAILQAVYLL